MIRNLFKAVLRALFGLLYRVEVRGHVYGLVNYERTRLPGRTGQLEVHPPPRKPSAQMVPESDPDNSSAGKRLEPAEHRELNALLSVVFEDAEYRRLNEKKNRWKQDYLHKLSRTLVEHCKKKGIEVIVFGRNIGWKQETSMGRAQNRRFCQVAHATLIDLIRYKAQVAGIGVVEVEESYTSKTSFVNDDVLENFEEKEKARQAGETSESADKTGQRSRDRQWFTNEHRTDRWRVVHADVNGAFNIIRKIFRSFKYHAGLTLKYDLYRLSPRLGVVSISAT